MYCMNLALVNRPMKKRRNTAVLQLTTLAKVARFLFGTSAMYCTKLYNYYPKQDSSREETATV